MPQEPPDPTATARLSHARQRLGWQLRGACTEMDPDLFFPDDPGAQPAAALDACGRCHVRSRCLAWALDNGEMYGVWGGTTETERLEMALRPGATAGRRDDEDAA